MAVVLMDESWRRCRRAFCRTLILLLLASLSGCGGFYLLSERPVALLDQGAKPPDANYLTLQVDLANRLQFLDVDLKNDRNGSLRYLYVAAQFQYTKATVAEIPLLLVDLDSTKTFETHGANVVRRFPIEADAPAQAFISVKIQAISKANVSTALALFDIATEALNGVNLLSPSNVAVLNAVGKAAKSIEALSTKKWDSLYKSAFDPDFPHERKAFAYLILPTDGSSKLTKAAARELDRLQNSLKIEWQTGKAPLLMEGDRVYSAFPYIVFGAQRDRYSFLDGLLPMDVGADCNSISPNAIVSSQSTILTQGTLLVPGQLGLERALVDRASALLELNGAVTKGDYLVAVDTWDRYPTPGGLGDSLLARDYFATRLARLDSCAWSSLAKVPAANYIDATKKELGKPLSKEATAAELEKRVAEMALFTALVQAGKDFAFLKDTRLFARATAEESLAEMRLYDLAYSTAVEALDRSAAASQEFDRMAEGLEQALRSTSCRRCKNEARRAVTEYRNRSLSGTLAAVDRERVEALARVAEAETLLAATNKIVGNDKREMVTALAAGLSASADKALAAETPLEKRDTTRLLREELERAMKEVPSK